jgi:hypothetical protein
MHSQLVVTETQGDPMEHGLDNHVREMQTNIERMARGSAMQVAGLTLSSTMIGDEIRYSSIATIVLPHAPVKGAATEQAV